MRNRKFFEMEHQKSQPKKDFLIVIIFSSILVFAVFYYTFIFDSPASSTNLAIVKITFQGEIDTDDYVEGNFELESPDDAENVAISCKLKIRGRLNAQMPKKGYRIELSDRISLLGMRKDDDWQLFAMFMDLTNLRIKLAMDLWRSLLPTDPTAILPKSEFVILYINGEFQGLYLLAEKNDRRLFGLEDAQNNGNTSLIFQSDSHDLNFYEHSDEGWDQDWPNEYDGIYIKDDVFRLLVPFISQKSDIEFFNDFNGIYTKFDKNNLIDFLIFNYFILHLDFWSHNYFLVRNTHPNKFFLVPWDFDSSFGQYLGRKYDIDENIEQEILRRNYLYVRLMGNEDFKTEVKNRWYFLRETIWSEDSILDMLTEIYDEIRGISEIDVSKWYLWYYDIEWALKVDEAIENLYDWIPERLVFCDSYFGNF
jgi:spore coat protein CotH